MTRKDNYVKQDAMYLWLIQHSEEYYLSSYNCATGYPTKLQTTNTWPLQNNVLKHGSLIPPFPWW